MEADARTNQINNLAPHNASRVCPKCKLAVSPTLAKCPNDGTLLIERAEIGQTLAEQYEFISIIATGGMSIVYLARHIALNQQVAIKMMQSERLDEHRVSRFKREAEALSALEHINIVHVRNFGVTETGQPYMVLDYTPGRTLEQVLKEDGALDVRKAIEYFAQIADALQQVHERGILHRDLKPANILICEPPGGEPFPRLIDFGIAKMNIVDASTIGAAKYNEIMGSPPYMSPEQTTGSAVDERSDIYSLGCVLFEALVGTPVFAGETAVDVAGQHLHKKAPTVAERTNNSYPHRLSEIVAKCLEKKPEQRYRSMEQLRDELLEVIYELNCQPESPRTTSAPTQPSLDKSARRLLVGCCVAMLVVIVALNVYLYIHTESVAARKLHEAEQRKEAEIAQAEVTSLISKGDDVGREVIRRAMNEYDSHAKPIVDFVQSDDNTLEEFSRGKRRIAKMGFPNSNLTGPGLAYLIRFEPEFLSLNGAAATDRAFLEIRQMKRLRELQLDETGVTNEGLALLKDLPLVRLSVKGIELNDVGMKNISNIKTLEILQIGKNLRITDVGYSYLDALPNLKTLDVQHNRFDDKSIRVISRLNVDDVNFESSDINDQQLKLITTNRKLTKVNFSDCKRITSAGMQTLANLKLLRTAVVGETNQRGDDTVAFVEHCPNLVELSLKETDVTDAGIKFLIAKAPQLQSLSLQRTKMTNEGLMLLLKLKYLQYLFVYKGQFSKEAVDKFERLRPNVIKWEQNKKEMVDSD